MNARELRLDYFRIYDVVNIPIQATVSIQGQFDRIRKGLQVMDLDSFGIPVSKHREPLFDAQAHLAWYRAAYTRGPEPTRLVVVENQFGRYELKTGNLVGLLAPAQKYVRGSEFPRRLDHYGVYMVLEGPALKRRVELKDQLVADRVEVMIPHWFAVPVKKVHDKKTYDIQNTKTHLVIYTTTSRDINKKIVARDQFGRRGLIVVRNTALAVPSIKLRSKPA